MASAGHLASSESDTASPDALAWSYTVTRDFAAREALVQSCHGLVRRIASDFNNPGQEDDLIQVGYLGLLNAIEHFDPSRGTPFIVFARHFVRGEIRHYLRDHNTILRRPRWLERLSGQIEEAIGEHLRERGRYPGLAELAQVLNLELPMLAEILRTRQVVRTLSLDAEDENGQLKVDLTRTIPDDGLTFPLEDRMMLIEALESLNMLQRTVVFYIFFTDLTQAETAQRIGISQKHVSRVLASALHSLRTLLSPPLPVD